MLDELQELRDAAAAYRAAAVAAGLAWPSPAGLLTQWAKGITSGVITYRDLGHWLLVAPDAPDDFQLLLDQSASPRASAPPGSAAACPARWSSCGAACSPAA